MSYIEENGYFIFDGIKSSDYGVWISGGGTFNAPKRRYKDYTVPGRNGTLTIDEGAFEEIEVIYPAFIARDFPANIEAFRNELMARSGYVRMTDSYHPDEYYMAKYMDGLEADVLAGGVGGQFNLTFRRDPRRFLTSGETTSTIGEWGETETASGEIVSANLTEVEVFKSVAANFEPVQAGTGDPSPSNVRPISGWTGCNVTRTGKNILERIRTSGGTSSGVTFTVNSDDSFTFNGTATSNAYAGYSYTSAGDAESAIPFRGMTVTGHIESSGSNILGVWTYYKADGTYANLASSPQSRQVTFTIPDDAVGFRILFMIPSGVTVSNAKAYIQLELGSTATAYEPYQGNVYPITFPSSAGTVYGGYVDAVNGKLVVDKYGVDLGTLNYETATDTIGQYFRILNITQRAVVSLTENICSCYKVVSSSNVTDGTIALSASGVNLYIRDTRYTTVSDFKTAISGNIFVYILATPIEYNLTPTQIDALVGTNNIWSDTQTVTVEYGDNPNIVYNPTLFEALPLIRVTFSETAENLVKMPYYNGTFTSNGITWTRNDDGTVIADGTATSRSWFSFVSSTNTPVHLAEGSYSFTCTPSSGSAYTYYSCVWFQSDYGTALQTFWDNGAGVNFTVTSELASAKCYIQAYVAQGVTAPGIEFYPVLVSTSETWCRLGVGDRQISLLNRYPYIDVDCDSQNCYYGTTNANQQSILVDNEFPVLAPGVNNINVGTGIEKVEVTPRWYRI